MRAIPRVVGSFGLGIPINMDSGKQLGTDFVVQMRCNSSCTFVSARGWLSIRPLIWSEPGEASWLMSLRMCAVCCRVGASSDADQKGHGLSESVGVG